MTRKQIYFIIAAFLLFITISGCASFSPVLQSPVPSEDKYSRDAAYHYSLAVLLRQEGKLDDAAVEMEQAIAADPDSLFLITEIVSLYAEKEDFKKAILLGEKTLAKNVNNSELHMIMGGLYLHLREHKKAIKEYNKVIKLTPKNLMAYLYLATIYAEEKNYSKSEETFKKMLQIDPDNIMGIYYYGKVLAEMNRFGDAEKMYKKTISLRPDFESAVYDLAALYEKQKKIDQAIKVYNDYLLINPARINLRAKIAELLIKDKKIEQAQKEYQEILKYDPDNREVRIALGILYYEIRRFDLAIAEFSAVLKKDETDSRIRYLLANAYEEKGEKKLAVDEYQRIPASFELYANAQINAAMIFKKDGKIPEAIVVIKEAVKKKNDQTLLYLYLASLYEENKEMAAAENILREGITILPKSVDLHYALGVIYEKTNRFPESLKEMEIVLSIDPENAEALNFIGYSYADRGINLDEAEKMIVKALKIKPDSGYMIDSLGWVHFKQNKLDSAKLILQKVIKDFPNTNQARTARSKLQEIK